MRGRRNIRYRAMKLFGECETVIENGEADELVKIKMPAAAKSAKSDLLHAACKHTGAAAVQLIGRVGIAYRPADKSVIQLP